MRIFNILIPVLALLLMLPAVTDAQVTGVEKGDKVRVTAPEQLTAKTRGIITGISRDSLQFMRHDSVLHVSLSSIQKLEVSTGIKRSAGRGALIGAGSFGLTLGFIMMATDKTCSSDDLWCMDLFSRSDSFKLGFVSGALLGGVSGAIIGHFIKRDRWEKINLEPLTLASHPDGSIPAIGIRLRL